MPLFPLIAKVKAIQNREELRTNLGVKTKSYNFVNYNSCYT